MKISKKKLVVEMISILFAGLISAALLLIFSNENRKFLIAIPIGIVSATILSIILEKYFIINKKS